VNLIRVSPDGAFVAVLEQTVTGGGPEWLTIVDRNGTVVTRSHRWASSVNDSLAWTPDGSEVWFTASEDFGRAGVHAMNRRGRERIVHRAMSAVRILDVASDGRALLANDMYRADMTLVDTRDGVERDLTWSDWSRPFALSNEGRLLAFGDGGRSNANGRTFGYIRPTDGSPAIQITDTGSANAISPDGKWVLVGGGPDAPGRRYLTLMPSGAGEAKKLDPGAVVGFSAIPNGTRWTPDGQRIVFVGNESGKRRRVFIQKIAGGPPEPLTPEGAFGSIAVSADSTHVLVKNEKGQLSTYAIAGGTPVDTAGALPGDQPLAWSGDSIWVLNLKTTPAKIFRIEPATGRRTLWRDVPYPDPAAIEDESLRVVMSADGSKFVYGYQKHLSDLYVATGLR
jgi:Tol biopolymer transport system component